MFRERSIRRATLLLGAVLTGLFVSCSSYEPEDVSFALTIRDQQTEGFSSPIQVRQNDRVTITVTADEHMTFHLHGYDLQKMLAPGVTSTIRFTASATGSFPFTIHPDLESHHHDHGHAAAAHECEAVLPSDTPAPTIAVDTTLVSNHEIRVSVRVTNFSMTGEENGNQGIASGHWHLFVDDVLIGMYSTPDVVIPIASQGHHSLAVTLTDNQHCSFDISASTMVELPNTEHKDHGAHATDESEIELGRLEVRP